MRSYFVGLVFTSSVTLTYLLPAVIAQTTSDFTSEELIFVTEDFAGEPRWGCDAISVLSLEQGMIHLGKQQVSPGRLAATDDLKTVLAIRSNGATDLYISRQNTQVADGWSDAGIDFPEDGWVATFVGGIAITSGSDPSVLMAAQQGGVWNSNCTSTHYGVIKLALSAFDLEAKRTGEVMHEFITSAPVAEILLTSSGATAHLIVPKLRSQSDVTEAFIYSISTDTLNEVSAPIKLPDIGGANIKGCGDGPSFTHATLSPDGHYAVINSRDRPEIIVADLIERRAWTLPLRGVPGLKTVGGVAFNWSSTNYGLLAIHGQTNIGVFDWKEAAIPSLLSYTPVIRPYGSDTSGPQAAIAWSTDGTVLIAAQGNDEAEFGSWYVKQGGHQLSRGPEFEVCPDRERNFPNDVLTGNGILPTATFTASPTNTPKPTQTPSPSATLTTTPSPSATLTSLPPIIPLTPAALPSPRPIYLPLLLREKCNPEQRRTDVVLVLDASLSMLEPSGLGSRQTKLDAAREAARMFVTELRLDRGDQAALVTFNSNAILLQELTNDQEILTRMLASIGTAAQTCIVCGLDFGAIELASPRRRPDNEPVLILLTDGRSNPQPVSAAVGRAERAKAQGIRIYTIGLGDELDEEALREMASGTGSYFHAPSGDELAQIYRDIAVDIPCPASVFWAGR